MGNKALKFVTTLAVFIMPLVAFAGTAHADAPGDALTWVNGLRGAAGMAPLAANAALGGVAQQWANHMATTDVLANNPNLSSQAPSGWTQIGENIGDGYNLAAIENILAAASASHTNILSPAFDQTGVGVATDSKGQMWFVEDFGDYPPPTPATFVLPTAGSLLFAAPQSFSWKQAPGAVYYCVTVGSTQGGTDLVNSGTLPASQLSYLVPALPGGKPLWARLYTFSQGTWIFTDTSFSVTGATTATFMTPAQGATNVDTTHPFTWSPVASAGYYGVSVGTSEGGYNLVNSGPLPSTQTTYAVPVLPTGKTLWARIYSYIGGSWSYYSDVSFTAAPRT
jgi:Cysteine-rich secretory protein family